MSAVTAVDNFLILLYYHREHRGTETNFPVLSVVKRAVRILNLGAKQAGEYVVRSKAAYWNGRDDLGEKVASGVYFYTLKAGEFSATRKMLIVK